jgi:hypothetical protein
MVKRQERELKKGKKTRGKQAKKKAEREKKSELYVIFCVEKQW